jgi:membrane protein DedA with SNARE-associated domain
VADAAPPGTTGSTEIPRPDVSQLSPEQLRLARRCIAILGVLGACSLIGVSFSLYLVNHYPLLLLALSPLGRHAVLVAPIVDPLAFMLVLVVRRLLFYGVCFQLGRALGASGIAFIERRAARFARLVRWLEDLFSKAPRLVVLFLVGPTVSALAGIAGMPARVYLPLATTSLAVRAGAVLALAEWFREPIGRVLEVIDEYWLPGTVLLLAGVALYQWRQRGRSGWNES